MAKIIKKIAVILLASALLYWFFSLIYCTALTFSHKGEFEKEYVQCNYLSKKKPPQKVRVLSYNKDKAKAYYIFKGDISGEVGTILDFENKDGVWVLSHSRDMWTTCGGSADETVWPYFWEGKVFLI